MSGLTGALITKKIFTNRLFYFEINLVIQQKRDNDGRLQSKSNSLLNHQGFPN